MAAAPEKAAPEDLQKIVASWKVIVGQTSGIFKQMLQKSIPKYNGQTGEPVLYIEFQDFLGKTYVDNPEAEEELKNIILAQTGKSVELKMVVAKEHNHTNLAKVTVDQALRENIHMDVVVEEDPDDAEEVQPGLSQSTPERAPSHLLDSLQSPHLTKSWRPVPIDRPMSILHACSSPISIVFPAGSVNSIS